MNEFIDTTAATEEEDWDVDFSDLVDDEQTETPKADTAEADQQTEGNAEGNGEQKPEANGEGADQAFTLKYLGAEKSVNRDEVITLAQKGMDYDRIRGKYEDAEKALTEAKEKLDGYTADSAFIEALKGIAEEQGSSFENFALTIIASNKAAKNGTTIASELPKVKLDFDRKSFEKQKADWETNKGVKSAPQDADSEMRAEIAEFQTAFPEAAADAKAIPKEVWDAKNAEPKKSLAQHYREYLGKQKDAEIESLKSQLAAAQKSAENKQRSTGSQSSSSVTQTGDIWDRMWAEN